MKHRVSVVIPMRPAADPSATITSLAQQEGVDVQMIIQVDSDGRGANWARNRGAERAASEFLLFSDDDILWEPGALACMANVLEKFPATTYAYGAYEMGGRIQCHEPWHEVLLRKRNFISTMTMMRRVAFPGFDEECQRLQDWDLWLTMLAMGFEGRNVNKVIFRTAERDGITRNGPCSYEDARAWIVRKHQLDRSPKGTPCELPSTP